MNAYDIILIILIAAAFVLCIVSIIRRRRRGGCSCGCEGCPHSGSCHSQDKEKKSAHAGKNSMGYRKHKGE